MGKVYDVDNPLAKFLQDPTRAIFSESRGCKDFDSAEKYSSEKYSAKKYFSEKYSPRKYTTKYSSEKYTTNKYSAIRYSAKKYPNKKYSVKKYSTEKYFAETSSFQNSDPEFYIIYCVYDNEHLPPLSMMSNLFLRVLSRRPQLSPAEWLQVRFTLGHTFVFVFVFVFLKV